MYYLILPITNISAPPSQNYPFSPLLGLEVRDGVRDNFDQGHNWVILGGGRRYIRNRKDEIIHGLSPSVKYVAPLFRDMFFAKV